MRSDVPPAPAMNDLRDRLASDPEEGAKVDRALATGGTLTYLTNLISGESGCAYPLPDSLPPLRVPIGHVVALGAKEQVGWVDAEGLVAAVKDALFRRDRAVGVLVGSPVGADESPATTQLSVATTVGGLRPEDARVHGWMVTQ